MRPFLIVVARHLVAALAAVAVAFLLYRDTGNPRFVDVSVALIVLSAVAIHLPWLLELKRA